MIAGGPTLLKGDHAGGFLKGSGRSVLPVQLERPRWGMPEGQLLLDPACSAGEAALGIPEGLQSLDPAYLDEEAVQQDLLNAAAARCPCSTLKLVGWSSLGARLSTNKQNS
ncbi:hypothetical protein NDU88_008253 [Pleurodeles waltl]|uniref:Uncharacterized protein n=1 Tax=Pleurodeles waltl TaxID=8319 RepID=A0AAV7RXG0_PLEWA|nr:hypothetical protein NDU88_008253 [Pleurodeles waltl]